MRVMCKPGSVGDLGGQPPRSTRPEAPFVDGIVFVRVCGNKVAQRVEVHLHSVLEFALSEKPVHDFLRLMKLLVGLDRSERKGVHKLQIRVPACSLQAELRLHCHGRLPLVGRLAAAVCFLVAGGGGSPQGGKPNISTMSRKPNI